MEKGRKEERKEGRNGGREGRRERKEELDKYLGIVRSKALSFPLYKTLF